MEESQYAPEQQRSPNRFQQQEDQIYSKGIREIEKSQQFQSRYEAQIQAQSLAENKIGELEILLERERKRTREIRSDLIKELEKEKMLRQHAEENLLSIKDQAIKGEQENSKTIQDLEFKLNNIQNDKQQIIIELKRQKDQLGRVQTNTSENARILEENLLQQARMTAQLEENSRQQQDRLKSERINELRELQNEWERRVNFQEDQSKTWKQQRQEIDAQIKLLRQQFMQMKQEQEVELKSSAQDIRTQFDKNYSFAISTLKSKIQGLEEAKERLTKQNQELQRQVMKSESSMTEQNVQLETQHVQINQNRNEQVNQMKQWSQKVESQQNDLNIKQNALNDILDETNQFQKLVEAQELGYRETLQRFLQETQYQRKQWEAQEDLNSERIVSLEKQIHSVSVDLNLVKYLHSKLGDSLKENLQKCISDQVRQHVKFLDSAKAEI